MNKKLWYTSPAETFDQALPIGNGSFGGMVYGQFPREKMTLNLDTFWSGNKQKNQRKISRRLLADIKEQIMKGNYKESQERIEASLLGTYNESYMPFGTFWYEMINAGKMKNYKRSLDIERGVVETEYDCDAGEMKHIVFASYVDSCIVGRVDNKSKIPFALAVGFESELNNHIIIKVTQDSELVLIQEAPSHVEPNYVSSDCPIVYDATKPGMKGVCTAWFRVKGDRIKIKSDGKQLFFDGVVEMEYYLAAADGYCGYAFPTDNDLGKLNGENQTVIGKIKNFTFEQILYRHIKDYRRLYDRVKVSLGEKESWIEELPTNERLLRLKKGGKDPSLYELYFQYNRYLMIASSRPGSQPANLQGIWNESTRPVWSSNWTININTEMNYWMAMTCNLAECFCPLLDMVEELSWEGQKTARNQYHCKGWVANHNVDLWRQTFPVGGEAKYAYWPMGGIWLANQIMDYYRYTLDKKVLREKIYPIIQGAVEFCVDWLFMGKDGYYHTAPSVSPENNFIDQHGNAVAVSNSCTMDRALIRELLMNYLEICELMGQDNLLVHQAKERMEHLPEYGVGKQGELMEWLYDFEEEDAGHRHFSSLVGFHPGRTINKIDTPDLVEACKKTLEKRLANGGGHIGWSCAWLISFYARLGNGKKALEFYTRLLTKSSYDNLFDLHPPLGESKGEREVFQIDGNFGSAAGFASMFLQSHLGILELLPALPPDWTQGEVKGLMAEGKIEVSLSWKNNRLVEGEIISHSGGNVTILYEEELTVENAIAQPIKEFNGKYGLEFPTKIGGRYTIYTQLRAR